MDIDEVKNMYRDGLGAQEIAQKFQKSIWQIYKFMKKNNISRRTAAQTTRLKFLKSPLSYCKKECLSDTEYTLFVSGLMLYWAEGSKLGVNTVDFANSNVQMVQIFLRMLFEIYNVNKSRVRVLLYCYSNQNPNKLIELWSDTLGIKTSQFTKPYVRKDFDISKSERMKNGMVHIRYSDTRLLEQIKQDIDKIASELSRNGRAVKYTTL